MSLIDNLIAKLGADVALQAVSSRAIAVAVGHLFQAGMALRSAPGVNATDVRDYLMPAMQEVARQLEAAGKRAHTAALEKAPPEPTSNLVRAYEDQTADFLTEVNQNGGGVQLR